MTSKEAIQVLKNHNNRKYELVNKRRYAVSVIEQDLEILEAIKNKAQNNRFFRGCLLRMFVDIEYDGKYFRTKKKIKDEDYEKIVRWLDA